MQKPLISHIFILLCLMMLLACAATKTPSPQRELPKEIPQKTIDMGNCVCIQLWMPVCGENGITYSNACFANCAKVKYTQGDCKKTEKI